MAPDQELTVITKTYDVILWSCNHTSRFPRNHRYGLGDRIERNLYDLLETLIQAKYRRNRQPLLTDANVRSACRNWNQPTNTNNNVGFRVASTLQQTWVFAKPESGGNLRVPAERAECQVQAVVPCRSVCERLGQMKLGPGGSGRPQGSNAPPGPYCRRRSAAVAVSGQHGGVDSHTGGR